MMPERLSDLIPHPGAVAVNRFLEAIRGEIHGSNIYEVITPDLMEAILVKIRGGDFDYFLDHFAELAKHYRPLPRPRQGVDGSVIIELERISDLPGPTDLEARGMREKPRRMQVQQLIDADHLADEDTWMISATGADVPGIVETLP